MKIVKERLVVEGVGGLQYDGGKEEVEEEVRAEGGEVAVQVSVLHQESPHHPHHHQHAEIGQSGAEQIDKFELFCLLFMFMKKAHLSWFLEYNLF